MTAKAAIDDSQFEDAAIKSVSAGKDGWTVEREDGWSFFVPDHGVEPRAGDSARFYGRGIGYPVRGLTINGEIVFYRTEAEEVEHREIERFTDSPQALLERWDSGKSCWMVEMGGLGPGYEQAIQIMAFEFLRAFIAIKSDAAKWAADDAAWKADREAVEKLAENTVHRIGPSGAQHGAAMNIATCIYRHGPRAALKMVDEKRLIQVSNYFPV